MTDRPRAERLRADCTSCAGLCCVAPAFARSADFAVDKPAGHACPNLRSDFRCGVHGQLRERGFPGCAVFDCFGAGQQVTQITFGGRTWREPGTAGPVFAAFAVMRQLHELLWYLTEALDRVPDGETAAALAETERLTRLDAAGLDGIDMVSHRERVNVLLRRTSEIVRRDAPGPDHRGADLVGRDLRRADLRGASLRGALLIGADLRGADLSTTDVTGADLRATRLAGATLTDTLFLTQFQVNAARGDGTTRLPPALTRPPHWRS